MNEKEKYFMEKALAYARLAYSEGEVPVGAVIAIGDDFLCGAYNQRETQKNALLHAETSAIYQACELLGGWRLPMCDLYVTMEPCVMCAGAIINARIKKVVFGVPDQKFGAFGSVIDVTKHPFNHKPEVLGGVCAEESLLLLQQFFKELREHKRKEK
ncbi:MAG: nucleoside deaminase [Clostridiales bacterium]|nr:nucleoside deaminase [Clostridiales bacterium]